MKKFSAKVIGIGAAGSSILNILGETEDIETIAIDTSSRDMPENVDKQIPLGIVRGDETSAVLIRKQPQEMELKRALKGSDLVFITCGLGGDTGTGAAPTVAEITKKMGIKIVGVCTMPFSMEGQKKYEKAVAGLEKLESLADVFIVVSSDGLLKLVPDVPLHVAFHVMDAMVANSIKSIAKFAAKMLGGKKNDETNV